MARTLQSPYDTVFTSLAACTLHILSIDIFHCILMYFSFCIAYGWCLVNFYFCCFCIVCGSHIAEICFYILHVSSDFNIVKSCSCCFTIHVAHKYQYLLLLVFFTLNVARTLMKPTLAVYMLHMTRNSAFDVCTLHAVLLLLLLHRMWLLPCRIPFLLLDKACESLFCCFYWNLRWLTPCRRVFLHKLHLIHKIRTLWGRGKVSTKSVCKCMRLGIRKNKVFFKIPIFNHFAVTWLFPQMYWIRKYIL